MTDTRSSSGSAKVEQMRASKHTEQSGSKTWTAGIDVLRSYPYQDTQWHLHAIEFHHKIRGEAEALRDKWLAAQSGDVAQAAPEPFAWVVYASNGNVRLWSQTSEVAEAYAAARDLTCVPLYASPVSSTDRETPMPWIDAEEGDMS